MCAEEQSLHIQIYAFTYVCMFASVAELKPQDSSARVWFI